MVIEKTNNTSIDSNTSNEVMVTLEYDKTSITFPINPEMLKEVIDSSATTENIEGIGEISIPQIPSLSTISFSSFFWADIDKTSPKDYVKWIKTWQKSRKPARFSVSVIDWDIYVTCESFSHWVNAGEEKDIYFSIVLKEYRKYGAKPVKVVNGQYVVQGSNAVNLSTGEVKRIFDFKVEPNFLITTNKRANVNKSHLGVTSLVLGDNESVLSITKGYSNNNGKDWKELYMENKGPIAESVSKGVEGAQLANELAQVISESTNLSAEVIEFATKILDSLR